MGDSAFENDPRRLQELRGRPIADGIYQTVLGSDIGIARMDRPDSLVLDIEFAIDLKITLPCGLILLGQEKFLSHRYASFETVTIEYEQDQLTHETGDWGHMAAQVYFVGYFNSDETAFSPWVLLNWPATVLATAKQDVPWKQNANKDGRARASFRYCQISKFPPDCIIARGE